MFWINTLEVAKAINYYARTSAQGYVFTKNISIVVKDNTIQWYDAQVEFQFNAKDKKYGWAVFF